MDRFTRDFVSEEQRFYAFKIGKTIASSLAGFVAGAVLSSMMWGIAVYATSVY
mgnify:FL=1